MDSEHYIRYLGAFFLDKTLNSKEHVKRKFKNFRKYLITEATEILVLLSVISHLDYCNVILYGIALSEILKKKFQIKSCAPLSLPKDTICCSIQQTENF